MKKNISMQDIADRAGVSRCTVSLVLGGKGESKRISQASRERILSIASEMGYRPNEYARGLRTGRSRTIGVVVSDISNEFFGTLLYHIQKFAQQKGYSVIVANSDEKPEELARAIDLLESRKVDGMLVVPTKGSADIAKQLTITGIPTIQMDRFVPEWNLGYVLLDNFSASRALANMLISKGCRRIAMVRHKGLSVNGRSEGYIDALTAAGAFNPDLLRDIDYDNEENDMRSAIESLCSPPVKADAIIFHSHELFRLGQKVIRKIGLSIPRDITVATFDVTDAFSLLDYPIIAVEQPIERIAEESVNALLSLISGEPNPTRCLLPGRIVEIGG